MVEVSMTNFTVTVFTFAWWWGFQCGGASCAHAHCAHWINRPCSSLLFGGVIRQITAFVLVLVCCSGIDVDLASNTDNSDKLLK